MSTRRQRPSLTPQMIPPAEPTPPRDQIQNKFYELLNESRFVERVIEIHLSNEPSLFREHSSFTTSHGHHLEDSNGAEWQELVEQNLPHWLFWLTHILTTQAKLAAEDRPMSRTQLLELLNDRLFRHAGNELRLKSHRKKIWTAAVLRSAVHGALKDIHTPGAVTLENLGRRITARSRDLAMRRSI
jgi:hypothetical protein